MATITHSGTLPDSSQKTDFYAIIDNATLSSVVNVDIAVGAAIADTKLAQITTASKVHRTAIYGDSGAIEVVFDGAGSVIGSASKLDIEIPFACTITSAKMFFDTTSETKMDIWKDTYANYPPTVADTIIATNLFTTVGATAVKFTATISLWTVAIVAGDIIRFNVESNTLATRILISLTYSRP